MGAFYLTESNSCSTEWGGSYSCIGGFVGQGWYYYPVGMTAWEVTSPQPVHSTVVYGQGSEGTDYSVRALDLPMPDPGYIFGSAVDFSKLTPTTAYGGYVQHPAGAVTDYLNDHFGAALAAYLNERYRAPILAGIAGGNVPQYQPGILAHRPYGSDTGLSFGWIWDGGIDYLAATPGALRTALSAIGASDDPIVQSYLPWFDKAQESAYKYDEAYQEAIDKQFYGSLFTAISFVVGAAFAIPAIAGALSTGTVSIGTITQAGSLVNKAISLADVTGIEGPSGIAAMTLTPEQQSAQAAFVLKVETQSALAKASTTMKEAVALAETDPVAASTLSKESLDTLGALMDEAQAGGYPVPEEIVGKFYAADQYITNLAAASTPENAATAAEIVAMTATDAETIAEVPATADYAASLGTEEISPLFTSFAPGEIAPEEAAKPANWLWAFIIGGVVVAGYRQTRRAARGRRR